MIYFVGAGPGAVDLITVRGKELLERADLIIYAGSLVNPALLHYAKRTCRVVNSASLTLEDVIAFMEEAEAKGLMTVRLHTGDPSIYGAIREQMDILKEKIYPIHAFLALALLCGCSSLTGRIHAAGCQPVRHHYAHGRPYTCSRFTTHSRLRRTPCDDGHFPECVSGA